MALNTNQSSVLDVGQTFPTIEAARDAVHAATVAQGLSFKVKSSDQRRFIAICRAKESTRCPFFLRIAFQARIGKVVLRKLVPHTCSVTSHEGWKRSNSSKLVANRHYEIVRSDPKTKPRQIQNLERLNFSNQIPYLQAWRAKEAVHATAFLHRKASYQLIYPFLESITDRGLNPDAMGDIDETLTAPRAKASISRDRDNQFEWCYIAPRACINAFWHNRRLICLDGAHMKAETDLVLLIVTTLDANENTLPLMWGVAKEESLKSWTNFLYGFREFFMDGIADDEKRDFYEHLTVISDRGKGLVPAVTEVLPEAFHYHCVQHLAANVGTEFGKKAERLFRAACLVDSESKFRRQLDQIEAISPAARHYIDQIDPTRYAVSAAPLVDFPRYGQTCSNIAESMNSAWMEARQLPLLYSLHYMWTYTMKKFYDRRHDSQKDKRFTNYCMTYFQQELNESRQYLVTPQERENQVAITYRMAASDLSTRLVSLKAGKCSCLAFQDHKIPCRHAIAAAHFFRVDPMSLIANFYQISEYRQQYKDSLQPSILSELEPDGVTQPPPTYPKSAGRRVQKRLKRISRETEARRRGRMKSPMTQDRQREQARARYQSGASHFQVRTSRAIARRAELSVPRTISHHLYRRAIPNQPFLFAQAPDMGQDSDIRKRLRDLQMRVNDVENMVSQHRPVINQAAGQDEQQASYTQEDQGDIESQPSSQQEQTAEGRAREASNLDVPTEESPRHSQRSTALNSNPSRITYNFQGTVSGFTQVNISGSNSAPQFTQNISSDNPRKRVREAANEQEDDTDEIEVIDTPSVRRSTRPQKRSRKAQNLD